MHTLCTAFCVGGNRSMQEMDGSVFRQVHTFSSVGLGEKGPFLQWPTRLQEAKSNFGQVFGQEESRDTGLRNSHNMMTTQTQWFLAKID